MAPVGVPRIGSSLAAERDQRDELLADTPKAELIGVIPESTLRTSENPSLFTVPSGGSITDPPPPPWETDPNKVRDDTDARSFVECPREWVLRWVNPRLLDQIGWRWWEPVMDSDPRVNVRNRQMVSVEGNVRRGGRGGDILAWMWRSWYESNQARKQERVARRTQSAVERFEGLKERRFGPYIRFVGGSHPRQTIGEGRTMRENE